MRKTVLPILLTVFLVLPVSAGEEKPVIFVSDVQAEASDVAYVGTVPYMKASAFVRLASTEYKVYKDDTEFQCLARYGEGQFAVITAKWKDQYIVVNGRCFYCSTGVKQFDGRIALPLGLLAKALGSGVTVYQGHEGEFYTQAGTLSVRPGDEFYSADAVNAIARIIHAEAGNQPLNGQIAVGNVVCNRVKSPKFPNTVAEVILADNQFEGTTNRYFGQEPPEKCVVAAKIAIEGTQILPGVLYFNTTNLNSWARRNLEYVATIGGHDFFK